MAEKNTDSPSTASSHAIWTVKNVWNGVFDYFGKGLLDTKLTQTIVHSDSNQDVSKENSGNTETPITVSSEDRNRVIASELDSINEVYNVADNYEHEEVKKSVWSDVDDELYIADLIKLRTSNADERVKRDTSARISVSDIGGKVVNSVKLDKDEMWELDTTELTECECLGPPPEFLLPPPPRPPFLQAEYYCGDDPISDIETCDTEPVSILKYNSYLRSNTLIIGKDFSM